MPTKWTGPLQIAVVALAFLWLGALALTLPLFYSLMPQLVLVPSGLTPSESQTYLKDAREAISVVVLLFTVISWGLGMLMVVGAWRRWVWVYWLTLVVGGWLLASYPITLLTALLVHFPKLPQSATPKPPNIPLALGVMGEALSVASVALFVVMVVVLIRIGPWACQKTPVEG